MATFSERLRATNAAGWDAAVGHRFVDELLAGTLADDVLAHYLVQDYQFCDAFTALLGQGCASAPDLDSRLVFARQLGMFASDENTYFVDSFDALGVPDRDRSEPRLTDTTAAFDALMREALHSRSYAQVLAVLLVAEWLYLDWATRPDAGDSGRPEHVGWIDLHRGPAFTTWVDWLRAQLDAHEPTDDGERRAVESVFARAVRCELAFFDAAYHD
ncbi:TenA family protein [Piscicoccus intestinalis]|uniref:TenA family protein n=1 Tax=Piscicoccus intestinalis TaxID=746033 RepID=UPI000839237A|nr:TenA family protein [Piscicoccus intestinalis]